PKAKSRHFPEALVYVATGLMCTCTLRPRLLARTTGKHQKQSPDTFRRLWSTSLRGSRAHAHFVLGSLPEPPESTKSKVPTLSGGSGLRRYGAHVQIHPSPRGCLPEPPERAKNGCS